MNAVHDKMPSLLRQLKTDSPDFSAQLDALLDRAQVFDTHVEKTVREIIGKVRQYGDQALLDLVVTPVQLFPPLTSKRRPRAPLLTH